MRTNNTIGEGKSDDGDGAPGSTPHPRRDIVLGAALVLIVCYTLFEPKLWRPDTTFTIIHNVQIAEAQAWWAGRADLPHREWDTAVRDGRVYSYFPPMFSFISACIVPLFDGVPHLVPVCLVLAVVLCAYGLFFRLTSSPVWGAMLTIGYVCGTSMWPVITKSIQACTPYGINHLLASLGVLLMLTTYFGGRRVLPAAIGLVIAAWSRQLTLAYALPLAFLAVRWAGSDGRRGRRVRMIVAAASVVMVIAVNMGLNTLKFGDPFTSGYMLNHVGRDDVFAKEARTYGLLSPHWVPRNLYYMNIGLPTVHRVEMAGETITRVRPNTMGTGIWWTTPLLIWVLIGLPRLLKDPSSRVWLIGVAALCGVMMFWHATGAVQRGFNRYSLDYMPVLFALVAPTCFGGRRRWVSLAMIAWGVVYFRWLI